MKLIVVDDYEEMSKVAADFIIKEIKAKPNLKLGLATGNTPIGTYENIVKYFQNNTDLTFKNVIAFNLDEYVGLSGDNPQSYKYFMKNNLFKFLDIKEDNCFIPNGLANNLIEETKRYDNLLKEHGYTDLQLLGIGCNGHIAFNEPSCNLNSKTSIVDLKEDTIKSNAVFFDNVEDVPKQAISMGIRDILFSKKILLLASGENKANAMKEMLNGFISTNNPASILQLHKDVTIILDKAAAKYIDKK